MKKLWFFTLLLLALTLLCVPLLFAADMLPAHQVGAFVMPALPVNQTPGTMLLWMVTAVISFLWALISEILPFVKGFKANGVCDFFVQGFKACVINPDADTVREELDALKGTVAAINASGTAISESWLNEIQSAVQAAMPASAPAPVPEPAPAAPAAPEPPAPAAPAAPAAAAAAAPQAQEVTGA